MNIFGWLTDPANWTGSDGIPTQIGYHLLYSGIALLVALAIAVPLGIVIGYTGRGEAWSPDSANALRALPSLGLLVLLFLVISPVVAGQLVYVLPTIVVLVLLAVPPILTGTYAGIQNADPDAVGAARGMGYTKRQILVRVQLPCALPLMLSGVRGATLQIVSTATIAAYLGLQGLGRFILDGRAQANFSRNGRRRNPRRRCSRCCSSSASPGSAGSSCHRGCGAPRRSPSHTSPPIPLFRPPPRCHPGTAQPRRIIMKKRAILSAFALTSVLALSRVWRRGIGPAVRRRERQGVGRLRGDHRLRGLHREPAHRQHLLPGAAGEGRQGQGAVQHRQPRGLHRGAQGRLDRPRPRVLRCAAELPGPEVDRRDQGCGDHRAHRQDAAGHSRC